ncbi:protein LATERAL ROOT PRIMORDIUM 1-like [Tasmannia lanceolata]|uniref:protein LATERAL ROOT PRIMORDIUM 1-like n=1 Tax=Tasmannia lanceolata TaxID=3420 RepID=UPI00406416EF
MGMVGFRDVYFLTQQHQENHPYHHPQILNNTQSQTLGVIPLLTPTPYLPSQEQNPHHQTGMINLWQNQNQNQNQQNTHYLKKPTIDNSRNSTTNAPPGMYVSGGAGGIGTTTCQDCGNQAKKDCNHRRCRTCCKSRGFDCSTHVKSTWVPASRRRERQLTAGTVATVSSASTSTSKKPRLITSQTSHTSTSNNSGSSSHQDASFKGSLPGQVQAPAVFKCVRVTAVEDDGEDEFAYQAVVKIGGHVFKGFLYDQFVNEKDGFPNISDLNLGGASSSSPPVLDPSDVYVASSAGELLGGTPYGNQIN